MKLGLGTAQFGMDYGISNPAGKVARTEVKNIFQLALQLGVSVLDTAPGYGDSESVLGELLPAAHSFQIVTKTPVLNTSKLTREHAELLDLSLQESLARLKQESIYGLLVHHADNLFLPGGELLVEALHRFVAQGRVRKIGTSVYTGAQIDAVLSRFVPDIIQVPLNVLDQRLVTSNHLQRMKQLGVEVHTRSVFLQGVLLSEPNALPAFFGPYRQKLERARDFARDNGLSALQLALGFVASVAGVDVALVGVTSERELQEILQAWQAGTERPRDWSVLACADEQLVDPSRWQL